MRKSLNLLVVSLFALTSLAVAAAAQQSPQKPGKWQVTVEMEIPGMPQKPPAQTVEVCITEAETKDPDKLIASQLPNSDCKVSDYKVKDQVVTYSVACPSQQMQMNAEIKYAGDAFEGTVKTKVGAQEMTAKSTGKWLGTCTK